MNAWVVRLSEPSVCITLVLPQVNKQILHPVSEKPGPEGAERQSQRAALVLEPQ